MLLSIPSHLGTRQQLLSPAKPGSLTPEMLLPVLRSRTSGPSSALPLATPPRWLLSHHLCAAAFAELGDLSRTSQSTMSGNKYKLKISLPQSV